MIQKFFPYLVDPTAKQIAARQLREAEADRLQYLATAEHARAMADMLTDRIARLKQENGDEA